jgi:hypothetical protein
LKQFTKANENVLKTFKLSQNYDLPVVGKEKQPTTLLELCQWGNRDYYNASIAFKLLLDELYLNTQVKMVFAVDDYNFLKDYSYFHMGDLNKFLENDNKPKRVHASEYVLTRGLNRILHQNSVCAIHFFKLTN